MIFLQGLENLFQTKYFVFGGCSYFQNQTSANNEEICNIYYLQMLGLISSSQES